MRGSRGFDRRSTGRKEIERDEGGLRKIDRDERVRQENLTETMSSTERRERLRGMGVDEEVERG